MSFKVGSLYYHPIQMRVIQITKRTNHMVYCKNYMSDDKPRRKKIHLMKDTEAVTDKSGSIFGYMKMSKYRIIHERHMRGEFIKLLNALMEQRKVLYWIADRNEKYTYHIKFVNTQNNLFETERFHQICYEMDILFF